MVKLTETLHRIEARESRGKEQAQDLEGSFNFWVHAEYSRQAYPGPDGNDGF